MKQRCAFLIDLSLDIVALLAGAAFAAGFVDAVAGGGALIAVPALLLAGFAPVAALGTNKLQGMFGTAAAMYAYAARGHVDPWRQAPQAALAFIGGLVGGIAATRLPVEWLRPALPVMLVSIALFFALKPDLGDIDRKARLAPLPFALLIPPLLAFYDGVFGPGTGSFLMFAFASLAGYGLLKATAHTKLLNFASNLGGFTAFAGAGVISWKAGLIMAMAQIAGARLGANVAMKSGAAVIKPLLIGVCLAMAARLLWPYL